MSGIKVSEDGVCMARPAAQRMWWTCGPRLYGTVLGSSLLLPGTPGLGLSGNQVEGMQIISRDYIGPTVSDQQTREKPINALHAWLHTYTYIVGQQITIKKKCIGTHQQSFWEEF